MPFDLSIVTPEGTLVERPVDSLVAPGSEGELGVLPGHEALLTALDPGEIRYRVEGREHRLRIGAGFAEVTGTRVTVLAETAEDGGDGGSGS